MTCSADMFGALGAFLCRLQDLYSSKSTALPVFLHTVRTDYIVNTMLAPSIEEAPSTQR